MPLPLSPPPKMLTNMHYVPNCPVGKRPTIRFLVACSYDKPYTPTCRWVILPYGMKLHGRWVENAVLDRYLAAYPQAYLAQPYVSNPFTLVAQED